MSDYDSWEFAIAVAMRQLADLTHGDAMGIIEAQPAIVGNLWAQNMSADSVAIVLLAD